MRRKLRNSLVHECLFRGGIKLSQEGNAIIKEINKLVNMKQSLREQGMIHKCSFIKGVKRKTIQDGN